MIELLFVMTLSVIPMIECFRSQIKSVFPNVTTDSIACSFYRFPYMAFLALFIIVEEIIFQQGAENWKIRKDQTNDKRKIEQAEAFQRSITAPGFHTLSIAKIPLPN